MYVCVCGGGQASHLRAKLKLVTHVLVRQVQKEDSTQLQGLLEEPLHAKVVPETGVVLRVEEQRRGYAHHGSRCEHAHPHHLKHGERVQRCGVDHQAHQRYHLSDSAVRAGEGAKERRELGIGIGSGLFQADRAVSGREDFV